jgi:hypothetical protein
MSPHIETALKKKDTKYTWPHQLFHLIQKIEGDNKEVTLYVSIQTILIIWSRKTKLPFLNCLMRKKKP